MNQNSRIELLHNIASHYVINGLGGKNFETIPYHEQVVLRAPIHPQGSKIEMSGKTFIKQNWWAPLPGLVEKTELLNTYVDKLYSAVTAEFLCYIVAPKCTLRIVDRFIIDDDGLIIDQENFFDPRDITSPEWSSE